MLTIAADVGVFRILLREPRFVPRAWLARDLCVACAWLVQGGRTPRRRLGTSSSEGVLGETEGRIGAAVYWDNYAQVRRRKMISLLIGAMC